MLHSEATYTSALNRVLDETDFLFLMKCIRGLSDFSNPWYQFDMMKTAILNSESAYKNTLMLLHMGIGSAYADIADEIGAEDADTLIASGLWRLEDDRIETNNYVVMYYQGIKLVVEVNPWFETCTNKNTDVYIGLDSLRLAEHIVFRKGCTALDLCSGSGVQGLLAAKSARKVVSVELNEKAVPVTRFNICLNGMQDVVDLRQGDLYSVLRDDETFDFIYANPPFIPMLEDTVYPICGAGGEDGLMVLRGIMAGLKTHLNRNGEVIIFCECLGDKQGVFFDKEVEALLHEQKGRGLSLVISRLNGPLQLAKLSDLTLLFDPQFDPADFQRRMTAVYDRLGATYLYSMVYKLDMDGSDRGLSHLRQYNPWDMEDKVECAEDIELYENGEMFDVRRNGKRISMLNAEGKAMLCAFRDGMNVEQTAKALFPTFGKSKKYKNGYPSFLDNLLNVCLKLETLGLIKRAKA